MSAAMSRRDAETFLNLFCKDRNLQLISLEKKPRNVNQWLGTYINANNEDEAKGYLLIGSRGYLWRRIGKRKWVDAFN